jgi:hypothetical protein
MIGLSIRAGDGAAPRPTRTPGLVERGIRGERPEYWNCEIGNRRYNASEFFRCIRKTATLAERGPLQLAGRVAAEFRSESDGDALDCCRPVGVPRQLVFPVNDNYFSRCS